MEERGLEGALEELRNNGVCATLDEFKGRGAVGDGAFDNPLIAGHYWSVSGGSRGTSRRVARGPDAARAGGRLPRYSGRGSASPGGRSGSGADPALAGRA